jgi:HSP20 family protein
MSPIMELERTLFGLGGFGRRVAHFFPDTDVAGVLTAPTVGSWVRVNVWDAGPNVVVQAEVPGMADNDIQISFKHDTLTIAGERPNEAPEGYTTHRRERASMRFTRSVRFGVKVDVDHASATVKNGILTITLPKHPQAGARTIAVQSATH